MGLELMKSRTMQSGISVRDEMIKDGRDLLAEELENDPSFSPTMYLWKYDVGDGWDDRLANVRLFKRGYSSLTGNYQKFLTTVDNPIYIGDYLHDLSDNTYWLVSESFNVDGINYEGKMVQCNYSIKWQLSDNTIVERYANIVSAAKYDTGRSGNATFIMTTNNYTILIGYDETGMELDGKRVFIDKSNTNPTKVFEITRDDDILYDSGEMGSLLCYIGTKTEMNPAADSQEMKLCDYRAPNTRKKKKVVSGLSAKINGLPQLKLAFSRIYSVSFWDELHERVEDVVYSWNVDSDFEVMQELVDNDIKLRVDADHDCGKTFKLQVLVDGEMITEIEIMVVEGM